MMINYGKSEETFVVVGVVGFDKESVGSNSPVAGSHSHQDQDDDDDVGNWKTTRMPPSPKRANNNSRNIREKDTCYRCKRQGHWAANCPTKPRQQSSTSSISQSRLLNIGYSRCFLCPCGAICSSLFSNTRRNPGRQFFTCPIKGPRCIKFKWADQVKDEEMVDIPICSCNAGPCRIFTEDSTCRKFFVCNIEKGSGACNFCQPMDAHVMTANSRVDGRVSSLESVVTCCGYDGHTSPARVFTIEEEVGFSSKQAEIGSSPPIMLPCNDNFGTISGQTKRSKESLVQLEGLEDVSSGNQSKCLLHEIPIIDGSAISSLTAHMHTPNLDVEEYWTEEDINLVSEVEISYQQELWRKISRKEITLPASSKFCISWCSIPSRTSMPTLANTATGQIGAEGHDWLGRLVYSPYWCLTSPAPKPFYCCIFPSFERVPGTKDLNSIARGALTTSSKIPCNCLVSWEPPLLGNRGGTTMMTAISEEFAQLAIRLQNKLLSLLESMDFHDHLLMVNEASDTFHALERLSIGFQPLCDKVEEFIHRASLLAEMESSTSTCCDSISHAEAVAIYEHEKKRWDEIACAEAKAKVDLEGCKKRVEMVREEMDQLRERLWQKEGQHSRYKAEEEDLERAYIGISKEKVEWDRRLGAAAGLVEDCRKREERDAEKTAFDQAYKETSLTKMD